MSKNYETYEVRLYPDGSKEWYQRGKLHRLDGPACEWPDGTKKWFIEDKQYSEQAFNQKVKELNNEPATVSWLKSKVKSTVFNS